MPGLTVEQKAKIWDMTLSAPLSIQQIAKRLGLIGRNGYQMVYRYLCDTKAKAKYLFEFVDSILWVRANPREDSSFFSDSSLDLICDKQNSEKTEHSEKTDSENLHAPLEHLKRASPERLNALLKLNRIQSFGHYEGSEWVKHNNVEPEVKALYIGYRNRTKYERLDMAYSPSGSPVFAESYSMPYKTRFTDKGRQDANLHSFRQCWAKASRRYCVACELTLTARPYGYQSLKECNDKTNEALEKFLDFMRYHLPDHSEYIAVREFQRSGRLHAHITFFGVNWLMHKSAIQYVWRGYGGGEILDVHTIRRRGSSWHWSRSRPEEATGVAPYDHLRKYLEKSMSPEEGFMFWATGFHNWSCSQSLQPEKEVPVKKDRSKKHFLKGIISKVTGYRHSNRSDTIGFFAGAFLKAKKVSQPKPKDKPKEKDERLPSFRRACELIYNP